MEEGVVRAEAVRAAAALDADAHLGNHPRFAPWLEHTFDVALGAVLFVELVLLFGNTATRALSNNSLVWANEVAVPSPTTGGCIWWCGSRSTGFLTT